MRRHDELIDPEVAASLDAIDATLAGEPVDPRYAELAELALLLAAERPELSQAASGRLDELVQRRFAGPAMPGGSGRAPRRHARARTRLASLLTGPLAPLAAGLVVVVVVVTVAVGVSGGGGGSSSAPRDSAVSASAASASSTTAASSTASATAVGAALAPGRGQKSPAATPAFPSASGTPQTSSPAGTATTQALQPPNNGRKITQSAQLSLSAPPSRIDQVSQELFNVIGAQNGIVNHSTVTATGGPDGYAEFQLTVPSANLPQTMAELSALRYASVVSRTDITQDVNDQYVSTQHQLADAQALRTSLLKQLANAYTQQQIDSLNAQIRDAEATIASSQAQLRSLNRQVNYSQIAVSINAEAVPVAHSDSSFTIGKGAHDAGRVLTVVAGAGLIALAALVPVALVVGILWWIGVAVRRRQREHALDTA